MTDDAPADLLVALFSDAVAAGGDPNTLLREWSARHPDLQSDFVGIVVEMRAQAETPSVDDTFGVEEQTRITRRLMLDAGVHQATPEQAPSNRPAFAGLREAAAGSSIGFPDELAKRLRLPISVLERLAGRQIATSSIPLAVVQQLSMALVAGRDEVISWLTVASGTAASANPAFVREPHTAYKTTLTFFDALSQSADMSDDDRRYWEAVARASRTIGPD